MGTPCYILLLLIISDRAFPPTYLSRRERIFLQLLVGVTDRWIINIVCHWLSLLFLFVKSPADVTSVFLKSAESLTLSITCKMHVVTKQIWIWEVLKKHRKKGVPLVPCSPAERRGAGGRLITHSFQLMNSLPRNFSVCCLRGTPICVKIKIIHLWWNQTFVTASIWDD